MGERTQYTPGTFCWTDLTTTDQAAAKGFYGGLFGWQADDIPVSEGVSYSLMRLDGKAVAAISPQPEQQRAAGVPPTWNSYISVEDADASAQRAAELGASVHAPAFDVMDAGRMAVLQDPQGGFVMLWQPRGHFGAQLVNAPGTLVWNELASPDIEASAAFYGELFDWTVTPFEGSAEPYLTIRNGDANNGGIRPLSPPGVPPHWLVYFGTEDIETAVGAAGELGGATLVAPLDLPMGHFAVLRDPQGAVFALYEGELEP